MYHAQLRIEASSLDEIFTKVETKSLKVTLKIKNIYRNRSTTSYMYHHTVVDRDSVTKILLLCYEVNSKNANSSFSLGYILGLFWSLAVALKCLGAANKNSWPLTSVSLICEAICESRQGRKSRRLVLSAKILGSCAT